MKRACSILVSVLALGAALAQVPETIVLDGVPSIPDELRNEVRPYLESRAALFQDWHPTRAELLITTRFADSAQLHHVAMPGGARRQLTFSPEPIRGASYRPNTAEFIVYVQDQGGGEFYQFYRFDHSEGKARLLTDGKSRNTGLRWSRSGTEFAYTSTRRNGRDNDIWLIDPSKAGSERLVSQVEGGGWSIADWSHDDQQLLLVEYLSINKSHLHLLHLPTGERRRLTPESTNLVAWANARFSADDTAVFVTTDLDSEFTRLAMFDLPAPGKTLDAPKRVISSHIPWDIEQFEIPRNGEYLAAVANENGIGRLRLFEAATGHEWHVPELPAGVLSAIAWHDNNRMLAFNLSSATSPADVYSVDIKSGELKRWTESETGGLDASRFVQPELITLKSFDGLEISAFVYRPDPKKFPGPRPAILNIHGGPESQSRPGFLGRNNYLLDELGCALIVPNVRGSSGYGKTFLTMDNGFKREDSVRDIDVVIDWVRKDPLFDPDRVAVVGGSYGGYMVLASMAHFNDRLRCGVDVVGISNFLTFLKNTQDYRRDLRRVEYGDERDPKMREFLDRISPTANVEKIQKPLLVMQGKNDPRVPVTEAEQMVKAIREAGGHVWYLVATDEGHGFAKKINADFTYYVLIRFLQQHLLN